MSLPWDATQVLGQPFTQLFSERTLGIHGLTLLVTLVMIDQYSSNNYICIPANYMPVKTRELILSRCRACHCLRWGCSTLCRASLYTNSFGCAAGNKQANSFSSVHLSPILAVCNADLATLSLQLATFIAKQAQGVIYSFLLSNLLGAAISDPVLKVRSSMCMNIYVLCQAYSKDIRVFISLGSLYYQIKGKRQRASACQQEQLPLCFQVGPQMLPSPDLPNS